MRVCVCVCLRVRVSLSVCQGVCSEHYVTPQLNQ